MLPRKTFGHWRNDLGAIALMCLSCSCSKLVIASFQCQEPQDSGAATADIGDSGEPFPFPWSTGFESGFCDYLAGSGFCYTSPGDSARYRIVTSPVHSGKYAAAFSVIGDKSKNDTDSRCVRQGILPEQAYYSAWYYVPAIANNSGVWNLFHFQGPSPDKGLWDISLINHPETGGLQLVLYQFQPSTAHDLSPDIPIGTWFHLQMLLKIASTATGEVGVWLDGNSIYQQGSLATDPLDSKFAQWYVGNLATDMSPRESTIYVDDVSVEPTL